MGVDFATVLSGISTVTLILLKGRTVQQGRCSSTYLDASTCCDDISFHVIKITFPPTAIKALFVVMSIIGRKYPQTQERTEKL